MTTTRGVATTTERRRPGPVSVRTRIAATIALVTTVAMASAGVLVYLLESARIDRSLEQQVDQEIAELRKLQDGVDPTTGRPFASVDSLLSLYLQRNVTDDDEMLAAYVGDRPVSISPNRYGQALVEEPGFQRTVERLRETGGTRVITSPRYREVWVTAVPVRSRREAAATGALVIINFADDERSELVATMRTYAVVTLASLALITLLAWWRAGSLLAPLTTLRTTAEDIGETDLSARIPEHGNDDITALTRTLNDMLSRLERAFVGQRQFLDDAGHELRTPLTVLRGHLELLDAGDPVETQETRTLLLDEVDRMARLVGDLILLAKSDRPDFVEPRPVETRRLTRVLLSKARGLADRDWRLDEAADALAVVDEQRITQAVLQLVENAVKHTTAGDVVALGSRLSGDRLELWVRDTGPGVAPGDREHIFERFGRSSVAEHDEGFGLGLSIVGAIAAAHGGEVRLDDDHPHPGARFVVTVPIRTEVSWHAS